MGGHHWISITKIEDGTMGTHSGFDARLHAIYKPSLDSCTDVLTWTAKVMQDCMPYTNLL